MLEKLKKNGGKNREARYAWEMPEMGAKTPARDPQGHWGRVAAHLRAVNPRDRRGMKKARKMLARLCAGLSPSAEAGRMLPVCEPSSSR
ncbi:hypothetical protein QOL99_00905 [Deinococcus sp. MIMF12]|uniref:Uncharacterized protein n=1 Tax=Deinococcus rhizophilus TaxID=3049544 RepID=A0ABT7JCE1_9DEIO|nr:hypothetical protein [Deinococcus rhizophilus]MDL2342700.1 hypothetical protein [Deinococcus rhizophilus]